MNYYLFWQTIQQLAEFALAFIIIGYFILIYNKLVRLKKNIAKAWSNIDVILKQRHHEIVKLVHLCKKYMQYEQETLQKILQARAQADKVCQQDNIQALGQAEKTLDNLTKHLLAIAEQYPDLKSNTSFQYLLNRISTLENTIADRRVFYNASVTLYNTRIRKIPDILIASLFRFKTMTLLEFPK